MTSIGFIFMLLGGLLSSFDGRVTRNIAHLVAVVGAILFSVGLSYGVAVWLWEHAP